MIRAMAKLSEDIELIKASGLFDSIWYTTEYPDVKHLGQDPIEHYLRFGAHLHRNPSPKFDTHYYLTSNPDVAAAGMNPLTHYATFGAKEGRPPLPSGLKQKQYAGHVANARADILSVGPGKQTRPLGRAFTQGPGGIFEDMNGESITLSHLPCFGTREYQIEPEVSGPCIVLPYDGLSVVDGYQWPTVAIHLHLHYVDLLDELSMFLANIPGPFSLYVSVTHAAVVDEISTRLTASLKNAKVLVKCFGNRGRDIGAFVAGFAAELSLHEVICHIHSKKSPHNKNKADWRRQLLVNLLGSPSIVSNILRILTTNPHIGMIFPEYHSSLRKQISWGSNYAVCQQVAAKLGIEVYKNEMAIFPAGSMFWARSSGIATLLRAGLSFNDFPVEASQVDGTLAHAIERLFGEVVLQSGFDLLQVKSSKQYNMISYHPKKWPYRSKYYAEDLKVTARAYRQEKQKRKARVVVYTAVCGGYDRLVPYECLNPDFDYVVFTDSPIEDCGYWDVRPMDYWHPEPIRMARHVKTHPHKYFKDYDVAIWLDANVLVRGNLQKYTSNILKNPDVPLWGIPHPQRDCIYAEAEAVLQASKDNLQRVERQMAKYREEGYPKSNGLIETGFLIVNLKCEKTNKIMSGWWSEIENFSHRDQLSLNYILWKSKTDWQPIMGENISLRDSFDFAYFGHGKNSGYIGDQDIPDSRKQDPYIRAPQCLPDWMDSHLRIDFVICVHNALDEVTDCLQSVARAMRKGDRIVIVDDASDEPTANYLKQFTAAHDSIVLLRNNGPAQGYCVSANKGMTACEAEYVLLLNSDTVISRAAVEKMLRVAVSYPTVGIVGPMSNAASSQSIPAINAIGNQTAINVIPQGVSISDIDSCCEKWSYTHIFPSTPLVHGFCQLIKKEVLEVVGGFDEIGFPNGYGEENDFCFRAADAGFDLKVATNAFVYHKKSASYTDSVKRGDLMKKGAAKLREKHSAERVRRAIAIMEGHPLLVRMRSQAQAFYDAKSSIRANM